MRITWPWRKHNGDQAAATDAYRVARDTLEQAHNEVILPLRELREVNHVSARLDALIQQRAGQHGHGRGNGKSEPGSAH